MANPKRAVVSRRYVFTPELLADGRHRYEHTDEPITSIALDFGVNKSTLTRLAKREKWVRYVRPPRDLPTVTKIRTQVENLAATQSEGARRSPIPIPSLQRRGEEIATGAQADLPSPSDLIALLYREAFEQFGRLKAVREQLTDQTQSQRDVEKIIRSLASLTATLRRLLPMQNTSPQQDSAYDDMPADVNEFRDELARRIRAFVASRSGRGDAGGDAAEPVDPLRS